jgi:hypothetical protein
LISYDVGAGEFVAAAVGVRDADDGGVGDEGVGEQEGFDFGGGDLEAFVFD